MPTRGKQVIPREYVTWEVLSHTSSVAEKVSISAMMSLGPSEPLFTASPSAADVLQRHANLSSWEGHHTMGITPCTQQHPVKCENRKRAVISPSLCKNDIQLMPVLALLPWLLCGF